MPDLSPAAVASRAAISSTPKRHPKAPKFSRACSRVLAPGMGTVPLQMHQLMATYMKGAVATAMSRNMTKTLDHEVTDSPYQDGGVTHSFLSKEKGFLGIASREGMTNTYQ
jgi:hypothetical protein